MRGEQGSSKKCAKLFCREASTPDSGDQQAAFHGSSPVDWNHDQFTNALFGQNHVTSGLPLDERAGFPKRFDGLRARDVSQDAHGGRSGGCERESKLGDRPGSAGCARRRRDPLCQRLQVERHRFAGILAHFRQRLPLGEATR